MIKTDIPENKEFFRVKRIIDELKVSPEYEKKKIILLINLANNLVREIDIKVDPSKIQGLKFSGTSIVNASMTETEILQETIKALEERYNIDVVVENMSALIRFWKIASGEKETYKPLINEFIKILEECQKNLTDADADALKTAQELIRGKEEILRSQELELKNVKLMLEEEALKTKRWQNYVQPLVASFDITNDLREYIYSIPVMKRDDEALLYVVVMELLLIPEKRASIKHLMLITGQDEDRIERLQQIHHTFLEINPTHTMIGIIKRHLGDKEFNLEEYIKTLEERKAEEKEALADSDLKQQALDEEKKQERIDNKKKKLDKIIRR